MKDCRNCAKIFCENRDNIYECSEIITFVQAKVLEQPIYLNISKEGENNGKYME